ncbi:MAG: cation diffusion facilitator family transporter [Paludibacteraceae bacterium]|nr:cation diffusion facilitator family transporter [Paludibacteraceae bacterium]
MSEHHHHHTVVAGDLSRAFIIGIVINILYIIAEAGVGLWQGSMGLLADAGHNLGDVASLALSLIAVKLYKKAATKYYTYGYKKSTILVSLVNAVILLVAVGGIVVESISKFINPEPLEGFTIAVVAGIGVLINGITAYLFIDHKDNDLNVKGAYLHMAMDALVSLGVVVAGILIHYTGWYIVDPIIGFIVAFVIVKSTWSLLSDSLRLSLDGVPESVDIEKIKSAIAEVDGVASFHHLHVWAISTTDNALTVHIVVKEGADQEIVKNKVKESLTVCGINHATLELETRACCELNC